jgi:uncharacterized coiled-coil protein SlyX
MPAETSQTTHQGPKPGETVTESGIILPAGVDRQNNVRETTQFDNLNYRSTKYNSAGIDPDNPYNAFAPEAPQSEEATPGFAADQPRRSRTNPETGLIEKLVKYDNGEFAWVSPDKAPVFEKAANDSQESQQGLRQDFIKSVASGIDELERSEEKQDSEIAALKKLLEEQREQIAALTAQLAALTGDKTGALGDEAAEQTTADGPKYPGQEVELYRPKSKELEVSEPKNEILETANPDEPASPEEPEGEEEPPRGERIQLAPEVYQEIEATIAEARDKYAELTAKNRNGYVGHFLKDGGLLSTLLKKIPGAERASEWINEKVDRELNEARSAYEETVYDMQKQVIDGIVENFGDDLDTLKRARMIAGDIAMQADVNFELKTTAARMERSGTTNKFINWWVQQDKLGGKLKKAGLIAGVGLAAGVVAGLGGLPLIGLGAGVAFGAGTGIAATHARANGITEKGGVNTLAEKQTMEDIAAKSAYAKQQLDSEDGFVRASGLTAITEQRTADEKAGNRYRVKSAVATGGAGAGLGKGIGSLIREGVNNAVTSAQEPQVEAPKGDPTTTPPAEAPASELQGLSFDVQPGSGYTQELMEFAQANGHALTPDQSFELHQGLVNQFGADYIDINGGGNDVYLDSGDVRLTAPGSASWNNGVGQYIQQWMAARGLW